MTKPNNTQATTRSVEDYINSLPEAQQEDCKVLLKMMGEATGKQATMWGTAIVGFGAYHYKYESGREGDAPLVGFSARKQALSLYLGLGARNHAKEVAKLGKTKSGVGCLYVKRLEDVDLSLLQKLITVAYNDAHAYWAARSPQPE